MRGDPIPEVPVTAGAYLFDALISAGLCTWGAMGDPMPLSWAEIWAFGQATRAVSEPWEFETLAEMSRAYVAGLHLGRDEFADPPYSGETDG